MDNDDAAFEEPIPVRGSSWDPLLFEPGRYRPGRLTPRGHSDRLLVGLALAIGAGHPMPEFHWHLRTALMQVPWAGALWRRRFVVRFSAGLRDLGYRVETVAVDDSDFSVVVHAWLTK